MLLVKAGILVLLTTNYFCNLLGEQIMPNEFLQYFSTAAGINSLIFSLSSTIYSVKRFHENKKKNKGFSEGINHSIQKCKEDKLKNHIIYNETTFINRNSLNINDSTSIQPEVNISDMIYGADKLEQIFMFKNPDTYNFAIENMTTNSLNGIIRNYDNSSLTRTKLFDENIEYDDTSGYFLENLRGIAIE
ncbi:hypothetical protein HWI79_182 [Cryptosporidium felis]|nr:hypothetical protein HWI79_182 [Cryptosporidium felis]